MRYRSWIKKEGSSLNERYNGMESRKFTLTSLSAALLLSIGYSGGSEGLGWFGGFSPHSP